MERELINQEFALTNLFMLRRGQDPGFCTFVYQSIQIDKTALFNAKKLILKLLSEATDDPDELVKQLDTNALQINMTHNQLDKVSQFNNRQTTLEFYLLQKKRALEDNDYDKVFAIDSVINEYKFGFTGFDLQLSLDRYKYPEFKEKYNILMKKFTITTIDMLNVYNESELNFEMISVIDFLNPFFSDLIINYLKDLLGEELTPKAFIAYNKLLRDIMSILSIEWFSNLDFNRKIEILNKQYELDFILSKIDINSLIRSETHISMWFKTNIILNKLGYSKEAVNLSLKIVELEIIEKNVELLIRIHDDIAYGYKRKGDIKKAINYFKRKINLLVKNKIPKRYYHISVAYKNIAELYSSLNDEEKSQEYCIKAEKFFTKLSLEEKYGILYNLAMASQRTRKFNEERSYLERIVRSPGESPYNDIAHKRLCVLDTTTGDDLTILVKSQEIDEVMKNAKVQFNAWNFTKAMDSYKKLFSDIPNVTQTYQVKILQELGILEFYCTNFNSSASYFTELIKKQEQASFDDSIVLSHLIAIGILTKNDLMVLHNLDTLVPFFTTDINLFDIFLRQIGLLILLGSKENYQKTIKSFWKHLKSKNIYPYSLFGYFLLTYGYYDTALEYIEAGVEKIKGKQERAKLLLQLSEIHEEMGEFSKAITHQEESLKLNPSNELVYITLARNYAYLNNYTQSIKILNQGKDLLEDSKLIEKFLERYETIVIDVLNIDDRIPLKFRRILYEGERLYQSYLILSETENFDASSVLLQYSKFVETILDYYISYPFFQSIISEYGWKITKSFWPRSDQIFHFYKRSIEHGDRKQLTLGQWEFLIKNLDNQRSKGVKSLFDEYCDKNTDYINKDCILEVCSTLRTIRNLGVHKDIIEFHELKQKRPEIIRSLNLLIDMVLSDKE